MRSLVTGEQLSALTPEVKEKFDAGSNIISLIKQGGNFIEYTIDMDSIKTDKHNTMSQINIYTDLVEWRPL